MKKLSNWVSQARGLLLQTNQAEIEKLLASAPADVRDTAEFHLAVALHFAAGVGAGPWAAVDEISAWCAERNAAGSNSANDI